MITFQQHKIKT